MKIRKITFALAILICLFGITGCNSKEKESGVKRFGRTYPNEIRPDAVYQSRPYQLL